MKRLLLLLLCFAGGAAAQTCGKLFINPATEVLDCATRPASFATNGALYSDANGNITSTATGGAGTLCFTSASGGTPAWSSCSGSASTVLSALTAATGANTIASGDNAQVWQWALTSASKSAFTFGESAASTSTGTPILINIQTVATSTANPFQVTAGGTANGVRINTSGVLAAIGTGHINADQVAGAAPPTSAAVLATNGSNQLITATVTGTGSTVVMSVAPTITGHPTIEGVTSTGATGTGNFVFSAAPTFTGTITAASLTLSGTLTTNLTGGGTQCVQTSNTGVLSGTGSACGSAGGGDTITSPNGSMTIGGTSTNTTIDIATSYTNGLYSQLAASNTHSAGTVNLFQPSATKEGIRIGGASIPSAMDAGSLWMNASSVFGWFDGTNIQPGVSIAGSGTSLPSTPTSGHCVVWNGGFNVADNGSACGSGGTGTVTHTAGALTSGQLVIGNGSADIKVGDLSGDVTTSGSTATTVVKINGGSVPASAKVLGSNSSSQPVAAAASDIAGVTYVAGGGTANAQTAIYSPAIALTTGTYVCWLPTAANTGAATFTPNGLTAHNLVKQNATALAANDLITTAVACAVYDAGGTQWELQNPQTSSGGGGFTNNLGVLPCFADVTAGICQSDDFDGGGGFFNNIVASTLQWVYNGTAAWESSPLAGTYGDLNLTTGTASGNSAGISRTTSGNLLTSVLQSKFDLIYEAYVPASSAVTTAGYFFGWGLQGGSTQGTDEAGIEFDTSLGDTNFMCVTAKTAGGSTRTSMGLAPATGTLYRMEIKVSTLGTMVCTINGAHSTSLSTAGTQPTTALQPIASVVTRTTAARVLDIDAFAISLALAR